MKRVIIFLLTCVSLYGCSSDKDPEYELPFDFLTQSEYELMFNEKITVNGITKEKYVISGYSPVIYDGKKYQQITYFTYDECLLHGVDYGFVEGIEGISESKEYYYFNSKSPNTFDRIYVYTLSGKPAFMIPIMNEEYYTGKFFGFIEYESVYAVYYIRSERSILITDFYTD